MGQKLHGRATTTYAVRKAIQESKESLIKLSERYNINPKTVLKWKNRSSVADIKPGPTHPKSTVLSLEEEAIIIAFRKHSQLGLDDCLYSLKEQIPKLTRSSLHRCLQRHGISQLPRLKKEKKEHKPFKKYEPGYIHIDITEIHSQEGKLYLFVAIDRTTKYCFVRLYKNQSKKESLSFLEELKLSFPCEIKIILTDNGLQFTHHAYKKEEKQKHAFSALCMKYGIEHRLTKPYHPWTNGQVERINRTIKEATVKKFFYKDHLTLEKHLKSFINLYNYAKPLKTLKGNTPYQEILLYLNKNKDKSSFNPNHLSAGRNT